jgi:hypothetical protein
MSDKCFAISASSSSHIRRIAAASSGAISAPSALGIAASNLVSCRRVRSMKSSPSANVMRPGFLTRASTVDADINHSSGSTRGRWFLLHDHAKKSRFSQAHKCRLESRAGREAVTFTQCSCGEGVTPISGMKARFFLPAVEIAVAPVHPFGYAKETCLYELLSQPIA